MNINKTIFSFRNFDLQFNHILIFFILSLSFTTSFLLRSLPMEYGWDLHEYDPFFNFRATSYLVENGFEDYFTWNDDLSWYPYGRDVSSNSQVMLHSTAAVSYWLFGNSGNLYDFTIIFPVIFGSLTSIVLFALVRKLGGTTAGLISSLLFSISLPILVRGQIGWFKSEPLGLFFGLLATYFFLSGITSKNYFSAISKIIASGFLIIAGLSSWGGNLFFLVPLGIFIFLLPFFRKDKNFLLISIGIFTTTIALLSLFFERLGYGFLSGLEGSSLIVPTIIMFTIVIIQKKSKNQFENRNGLIVLLVFLVLFGIVFLLNENLDLVSLPTHRYLNAIFPLLTTSDPLTDSVSEHATLNIFQSFQLHSILMLFAGVGIWLLLKNNLKFKNIPSELIIYSLAFGMFAVYIGSSFMRLEVFTALGVIILSSIGISLLIKSIKNTKTNNPIFSISFVCFIISLLIIPLFLPETGNVLFVASNVPPTIMNGGTSFNIATNDWRNALEWIENNTPKDSVIGSWWDYGYWIQTISNRASLADNSTVLDHRIEHIANILFYSPERAWTELSEIETDYFIIFVSGEQLGIQTNESQSVYVLQGGGDESKKYWIGKIAGVEISKYLHSDLISGTDLFWQETLMGKLIPFEILGYVDFQTERLSEEFISGWTPVYLKQNKFTSDNEPFKLVYSSPSFENPVNGKILGVFVYEINKNYIISEN